MSGIYGRSEDSLITKLQSATLSRSRPASTYSSLASDEVELVDTHSSDTWPKKQKSHFGFRHSQNHQKSALPKAHRKSWRLLRRRLWSRVLPVCLSVALVMLLLFLSLAPSVFFPNSYNACNPDGEFALSADGYTPWKRSGFFAINIKLGSLAFWEAKFLDVAWDVVIGRGGQGCLAFFTYKVFTKGLTRAMQTTSVPHDTFRAVTLQNNSIYGLFALVRNFPEIKERHATGTTIWLIWMILSASFVLLFPTWLSAMTGYVSDLNPYINLKTETSDTWIPLSKGVRPLIYTIHDGARLNLTDTTYVLASWDDGAAIDPNRNIYSCSKPRLNRTNGTFSFTGNSTDLTGCPLLWAVSNYTTQYGFRGLESVESTFYLPVGGNVPRAVRLPPPTLDITASLAVSTKTRPDDYRAVQNDLYTWDEYPYGMFWNDSSGKYPFRKPLFYNTETKTVQDEEALKKIVKCQQTARVKYQWGFSFLLLFIFVITLMLWTIGMWSYYFSAVMNSRLNERTMGIERAAFDLAQSMQKRLDLKDSELLSNEQLRKMTKRDMLIFTDLPYDTQVPTRWMSFRKNYTFKKWMFMEKWWLAALFVSTLVWILSWFVPGLSTYYVIAAFGWLLGLGFFLVLVVGPETHGRWTLAAFFWAVFASLTTNVFMMTVRY